MDGDALGLARGQGEAAQLGAVRVGEGHVVDDGPVEVGVGPAGGAVDQLVAHDEVAGRQLGLERPGRARPEDGLWRAFASDILGRGEEPRG